MKKVLIGSTALLAAGMIAGPAFAGEPMTASKLDLSLGGDMSFKLEYQSRQPKLSDTLAADKRRNHNFELDGEMHVMGEAGNDAGLTFGFEVELEIAGAGVDGNGNDTVDQNWIWVDGRFGKVYLGAKSVGAYQAKGDTETYSGVGLLTADTGTNKASSVGDDISDKNGNPDENNKFTWVAPSMGGVALAIDYVPDLSAQNTTGSTTNNDAGAIDKLMIISLSYDFTMGGADGTIEVGYATANAEDPQVDTDIENANRWRVGGEVSVAGFDVGGFLLQWNQDAEDTNPTEDATTSGVFVQYETGPWTVGASWRRTTNDEMTAGTPNVKAGEDKYTQINGGVTYELSGDKTIKVGYETSKWDDHLNVATDENDAKSLDIKFEWDVASGLEFDVGYQNFRYKQHDITGPQSGPTVGRSGHALLATTKVSF